MSSPVMLNIKAKNEHFHEMMGSHFNNIMTNLNINSHTDMVLSCPQDNEFMRVSKPFFAFLFLKIVILKKKG